MQEIAAFSLFAPFHGITSVDLVLIAQSGMGIWTVYSFPAKFTLIMLVKVAYLAMSPFLICIVLGCLTSLLGHFMMF